MGNDDWTTDGLDEHLAHLKQWKAAHHYTVNDGSVRGNGGRGHLALEEAIGRMADRLAENPLASLAMWDLDNFGVNRQPLIYTRDGEVNVPPPFHNDVAWLAVGRSMSAIIEAARTAPEDD